jgi:hypothetical protein
MGSQYDVGGRRYDYCLFLDHDGRYQRIVRRAPDYERKDAGRWQFDESQKTLLLEHESQDELGKMSDAWRVLAVTTCEESNVLLVLREAILASRNLPILLYRVHCNGRGYGTDWEKRLPGKANAEPDGGNR